MFHIAFVQIGVFDWLSGLIGCRGGKKGQFS